MTPERALQIASAALDAPEQTAQCLLNAILQACREERHAALTEAAEICCPYPMEYKGNHPVATECAKDILALRDQEKP